MTSKHTPIPWRLEGKYKIVRDSAFPLPRIIVESTISGECNHSINQGDDADAANAAFIVRAVNAHNDLVAAIEQVFNAAEDNGNMEDIDWDGLREALAKAKGDNYGRSRL